MKPFFKRHLSYADIFLILVNLVPLWGVWFEGWDVKQVFIIYCLESIIMGCYNAIMMFIAITVQRNLPKAAGSANRNEIKGYWLILFFLFHYGFFVFIQLSIFIDVASITDDSHGFFGVFYFISHIRDYLSPNMEMILLLYIASYGLYILKDFIFSGLYKTASVDNLVFAPYARIFVQQLSVILGGLFLSFGAGKIFMLVFVPVKIYFENMLDNRAIIATSPSIQ